jgi:pimeloyl-ACP methyl ester carboxylesterase
LPERLIVLHGASTNGAAYADVVAAAVRRGLAAVAPDLLGHGSLRTQPLDGTILQHVRGHWSPGAAVLGHSFGGYLALQLAAEEPAVSAVVAFAPTADDLVLERFRGWDAVVDEDAFEAFVRSRDTYAGVRRIRCPVLYVHARDDDRIPLEHVERLHELTPRSELVVLESGGHAGPPHDPRVHELVLDWLARAAQPPPRRSSSFAGE